MLRGERFTILSEFIHDLNIVEINIHDDPALSALCSDVEILHEETTRLTGETKSVLADLFPLIASIDPGSDTHAGCRPMDAEDPKMARKLSWTSILT